MINTQLLPRQPRLLVSYWNVGPLLHFAALLFVLESIFYWYKFRDAYYGKSVYLIAFWLWSLMFSFIHIFLVLMDGWSRFQNYKRVKDYFYMYGFSPKVARRYQGSKCQRTAVMVAAKELGLEEEADKFYRRAGVKWHHFIPKFMTDDPLFLFKKYFWSRTFLEKYYPPKFNFRELNTKAIIFNANGQ